MWEKCGESLFPKYAEEVHFTLGVDTDSKIGFESFQFYGKDNRYSKASPRYGYFSFRATEDKLILPIPNDNTTEEPELYLVGVKGYHTESNNKLKYFLKFSDEMEKVKMDILYSHDEINNITISE